MWMAMTWKAGLLSRMSVSRSNNWGGCGAMVTPCKRAVTTSQPRGKGSTPASSLYGRSAPRRDAGWDMRPEWTERG